jgi:hypothetical protein
MGTILVHMFLLVIILFVKVNTQSKEKEESVMIDLTTLEEIRQLELLPAARSIKAPSQTRQARNIAVSDVEDQVEKYDDYKDYRMSNRAAEREAQNRVSKAVKDIIKENNLNPTDKEVPTTETRPTGFYEARKIEEEQVYKGPTNIYYKLDDRKVSYLPIPVYKCKGGATVQVDIRVGQRGKVEWASINGAGSDTRDPCFLDAAKVAALDTRFNFSTSAPRLQQGYIIYHFVAQ